MQDDHRREPPAARSRVRWPVFVILSIFAIAVLTLVILTAARRPPSKPLPGLSIQRIADHDGRFGVLSLDDINGDAKADLVLGGGGGEVRVYFGRPVGQGPIAPDLRITTKLNADLTGGVTGDVDGDGLPDLVMSALLKEPDSLHATGSSYIVRGRREWPAVLELPKDADAELSFSLPQDIRMTSCAVRGIDLNA